MKRWLGPLAALLVVAAATHAAALHFAPAFIMSRAMDALAARGVALHRFTTPARITPQTQTVVRSSPDLYYALCRYDLSNPGVQLDVRIGDWPDYQSLSFFAAQTDNFATIRGTGRAVAVRLLPAKGMTLPFVSYGGSSVIAAGITVGALLAMTRHRPQGRMGDIFGRGGR